MQTTYPITGPALINTLVGIAQTVAKPAPKARDNSLKSAVMVEAHKRYRQYRESNAKSQLVDGRWKRVPAAYSAADFGTCLEKAWNYALALRSKAAWENGTTRGVIIDEATFQSCRTDAMLGW